MTADGSSGARRPPVEILPEALVLFDIDGTLVDCGTASGRCFSAAFREAFGVPCPIFAPEEVSGLTDEAILLEVVRRLGTRSDDFALRRSRAFELYAEKLRAALAAEPPRALPGAREAAGRVRSIPGCVPGLLTGSTRATARIKLESAGIAFDDFVCGAFSDDGALRLALPPIAMTRFAERFGRPPAATVVVGDTPRDVEAALANGCGFIGVATGPYGSAALAEAGARVVLSGLDEPRALREAIAAAIAGDGR